MYVRLLAKTVGVEGTEYHNKSLDEIIVGIARISSSREVNELFDEPYKLLRYCILNGHWSILTQCNLTFEITTSRAIGRELLRHWSLAQKVQEFSQRYAEITGFEEIELRKKAENNRQSSTEVVDRLGIRNRFGHFSWYTDLGEEVVKSVLETKDLYEKLIKDGISKETARFILPECTQTTLVFNGTIREWITTLNQRLHKTSQKECRLVAEAIKIVLLRECPVICKALFNFEDAYEVHILDRLVLEKYNVYKLIKDSNFKKL